MTNKMVVVLMPNKMIANGNQAIDGIVCSPVISDPTAARNGRILDTRAPMTAPISTARRNPGHQAPEDAADHPGEADPDDGAFRRRADGLPQQAGLHLVPEIGQGRA